MGDLPVRGVVQRVPGMAWPVRDRSLRPTLGLHFAWIDVEDEAQAMGGEVDIETFPTVLVPSERRESALFLGPVQPSSSQLSRLLASLVEAHPGAKELPEAGGAPEKRLASRLGGASS